MITLWTKFQTWIIGVGAFLLAIAALLLRAFFAGKAAERAKQQAENLKSIRIKRQVENENAKLSSDELRSGFKSKWLRDKR